MATALSASELALLDPEEVAAGVRILFDETELQVSDGVVTVAKEGGAVTYRWRCTVCGYVHEATEPPRWCPLCGAAYNDFVREDAAS